MNNLVLTLIDRRLVEIIKLLNKENRIGGIYLIRLITGLGLADAKAWMEDIENRAKWVRKICEFINPVTLEFWGPGIILSKGEFEHNYILNMKSKEFEVLRLFMSRTENIDELIEDWHNGKHKGDLNTLLGWTEAQYEKWVNNANILKYE